MSLRKLTLRAVKKCLSFIYNCLHVPILADEFHRVKKSDYICYVSVTAIHLMAMTYAVITSKDYSYSQQSQLNRTLNFTVFIISFLHITTVRTYNLINKNQMVKFFSDLYRLDYCIDFDVYFKKAMILIVLYFLILPVDCFLVTTGIQNLKITTYFFFTWDYTIFSIINAYSVFVHLDIFSKLYKRSNQKLLAFSTSEHVDFGQLIEVLDFQNLITNMARNINYIFGLHLLLLLAFHFFIIVSSFQYMVKTLYCCFDKLGPALYLNLSAAVWSAIFFSYISVVLFGFEDVRREAKKSSILLHEIWNHHDRHFSLPEFLNVRMASIHLLNNQLKFSAYGFFPIDYSVLHMVVSSASTYVVTMLQMEKYYNTEL